MKRIQHLVSRYVLAVLCTAPVFGVAVASTAPSITTLGTSNISTVSAALHGSINPNGTSSAYTFHYGLTTNYGNSTGSTSVGSGTSNLSASANISGLTCGTTYNYRAVAVNINSQFAFGSNRTFTTAACPAPTAITNPASSIGSNNAVLNATINPNGISSAYTFQYGLTTSYGSTTSNVSVGSGNDNLSVGINVTGLACNTTYNFRVVAVNINNQPAYGSNRSFTTGSCPAPTATTGGVSEVSASSARLHSTINPNGTETAYTFEYGITSGFGNVSGGANIGAGNSNVSVSQPISGLSCGTSYRYRVVAQNTAGQRTNGSTNIFQTTACPSFPTFNSGVFIQPVAGGLALSWNQATGDVTRYELYRSTSAASLGNLIYQGLSRNFTDTSGLVNNTTYYYRARACNSVGCVQGSQDNYTYVDQNLNLPAMARPVATDLVGETPSWRFTVMLSGALPAGYFVALNFDNQQGGWLQEPQQGWQLILNNQSGNSHWVDYALQKPGLRNFRAAIFSPDNVRVSDWSETALCATPACLAAVMAPITTGDPALTGSGSLLMRGVDVASGNYHYSSVDLSVSGRGPAFTVARAYNSNTAQWTFNLDMKLIYIQGTFERQIILGPREDGHFQHYFKDIDDQWYSLNPGNFDRLHENQNGSFTLYTQGNLVYHFGSIASQGGRLNSISDRESNSITFAHSANRITGATDASGRSYTITRDGAGRITRVADFTQRSVEYFWDSQDNRMLSMRTPGTGIYSYMYSSMNPLHLTRIIDPRANTQYTIDYYTSGARAGKVRSVSDGIENTWTFTYTTGTENGLHGTGIERPAINGVNNNLVFAVDASRTRVVERVDSVSAGDYRTRQQYRSVTDRQRLAEAALVSRSVTPAGHGTDLEYLDDGSGKVSRIRDARSRTTLLGWEPVSGQPNLAPLTSVARPGVGSPTRYRNHTPGGHAQEIENPLGQHSYRTYNSVGLLTQTTDARGATTSIQYDSHGRPVRVTDANNNAVVRTYDTLGRVSSVTNARGYTTSFTYDLNGNMLTRTDGAGTTQYTYDLADNLTSVRDPRGHTISYVYDSLNRRTVERYTIGGMTRERRYEYDALGRISRVINERNHARQTRYDARNNPTQEIDPLSQSVSYTYDANGNVLTVTDAAGHQLTYAYDELDRKIRVTDSLGNFEQYTYNTQGLLQSRRDGRGQVTSYQYDALGRMTRVSDQDGGTTHAAYDANDNIISTTDRKNQTTQYQYDNLNRLTRLTDAQGRQWRFTYDPNGNLLTRTTPSGAMTQYTYNALDRLTRVDYPDGSVVTYSYDPNGNRLTMVDGNGTTQYTYDELNRLTSVNDAFGNMVTYSYDPAGNLQQLRYPGNRSVSYTYDAADRLTQLTDWLNQTTRYIRSSSGAINEIQYGNGARVNKSYDLAGRLTNLTNRASNNAVISNHSYTLDGAGNPTSASLTLPLLPVNLGRAAEMVYDASNRLSSVDGVSVGHDADGRMILDPTAGDPIQYAYNAHDMITQVTKAGVVTDTYGYDGDGRRVSRNQGDMTTRYVLDPTGGVLYNLLVETNGSNQPQYYYIYGEGLVSQISGSQHRYYHFDEMGNTLALTNSSGQVTDTYAYEPFGNTTAQGSSHNPFRFVGQHGVTDDGNGLHLMRARYYRPDLRRFVSLDALYGEVTDPMSINRYQYVGGNPMVGIDPSGYVCVVKGGYTLNHSDIGVSCGYNSNSYLNPSATFDKSVGHNLNLNHSSLTYQVSGSVGTEVRGKYLGGSTKLTNETFAGVEYKIDYHEVGGGIGACNSTDVYNSISILGIEVGVSVGPTVGGCIIGYAGLFDEDGKVGGEISGDVAKLVGLNGGIKYSVDRNKGIGKGAHNFGRWVYRVTH